MDNGQAGKKKNNNKHSKNEIRKEKKTQNWDDFM